MAEFIESNPSMGETTLPTNAGTLIRSEEWGALQPKKIQIVAHFVILNV